MIELDMSSSDLTELLNSYGLAAGRSTRMKEGVANASFVVDHDGRRYTLTILVNHTHASARRLITLTDQLVDAGVPTPDVLRTRTGEASLEWSGHPVILKPFVEGKHPDPTVDDKCYQVGRVLAFTHVCADRDAVGVDSSRRLPAGWEEKLERAERQFVDWVSTVERQVSDLDPALPSGLIHGDLFPDNVIETPAGEMVIIDWETAANDLRVLDIGFTIAGFAMSNGSPAHIVSGAESITPLIHAERQAVPLAFEYACAVLAYHRYVRFNLLFPGGPKASSHITLFEWCDQYSKGFDSV